MTDFTPRAGLEIFARLELTRARYQPNLSATAFNQYLENLTGVSRETFRLHFAAEDAGRGFTWRTSTLDRIASGLERLPAQTDQGIRADRVSRPQWSASNLANLAVPFDAVAVRIVSYDPLYADGFSTGDPIDINDWDALDALDSLPGGADQIAAVSFIYR